MAEFSGIGKTFGNAHCQHSDPVKFLAALAENQAEHRGSDFSDFLAAEGIRPEVEVLAPKRVVAIELQRILEQESITKTQLATRMKTRRASLDRILDPTNPSLTVATLGKAAAALGRKVELRFCSGVSNDPLGTAILGLCARNPRGTGVSGFPLD